MNYYRHHIGDYAEATAHLSILEDGVYCRLLRKYYATEKPLPSDIARVCQLIGAASRHEVSAVQRMLPEFFELRDDGWHQSRCDEEIAIAGNRSELAKENGSRGGKQKASNRLAMARQKPSNGLASDASDGLALHPPSPIQESKSAEPPSAPVDSDPRKAIFDQGKALLGKASGGLLSAAIARVGEAKVAEVIGLLSVKAMADPRSYFVAATTARERPTVVT